jgi:hypothetical protein
MAELGQVLRDQRINGRKMRCGDSDVLSCKHQEQMLEVILRENCDRPIGGKAAVQQGLPDTSRCGDNLRVRQSPPFATRISLGRANPVGSYSGPMDDAIGENFRIRTEVFVWKDKDRSISELLERCTGSSEVDATNVFVSSGGLHAQIVFVFDDTMASI